MNQASLPIKRYFLAGISIIFLAVLFLRWSYFLGLIFSKNQISINEYVIISILAILASLSFLFTSIFLVNPYERYGVMVLGFSIPFFINFSASLISLCILIGTLVLAGLASETISQTHQFNARFSLAQLAKSGMPLFFTSISIVLSFSYYSLIPQDKALSALLPTPVMTWTINSFAPYLFKASGLPPLSANENVKQFLSQYAEGQAQAQGINWKNLSSSEQNQILSQAQSQIEKQFGVSMPLNSSIGEIFSKALQQKINELASPFQPYLPLAAAVLFFFVLRTLSIFLYYVVYLLAAFLIYILKKSSIINVVRQQIEVERYII